MVVLVGVDQHQALPRPQGWAPTQYWQHDRGGHERREKVVGAVAAAAVAVTVAVLAGQ